MTTMSEQAFAQMLKDNPDLIAGNVQDVPRGETPAAKAWRAADRRKLEERFLGWWRVIGGPELEREYRFAPERKFRADFAHLASRTLIEIDGGYYRQGGGAHNSASKAQYELERNKIAWELGWEVRRLPTGFALADVEEVLDSINDRTGVSYRKDA